jgi:putative spermidine/putrescine transport system substrate-binding protein
MHGGRIFSAVLAVLYLVLSCSPEKPADPASLSWEEIEKSARGGEVTFAMWGGDARINTWIDTWVAERLESSHGIKLKRVPMDAAIFINKLLTEKQAKKDRGVFDLIWINGENFRRAREQGLLYGPFAEKLPNFALVDPKEVSFDFGRTVEGHEAPYGKAQFVFEYDSAKTPDTPGSAEALLAWARAHPGRFTYPQPPDFTGSAFLRQLFYSLTGGHEQYLGGWNEILFNEKAPLLWAYLESLRPHLWKEGRSYPTDKARLDELFLRDEVAFNMTYTQSAAQARVLEGRYPPSVRTFLWKNNSISNIHFTAIPFNSPNKAAAMVLANFLLSPEAQVSKNDPGNWGDFTVLSMEKLTASARAAFSALDLGAPTLSLKTLEANAVPEIGAEYVEALEAGWEKFILRGK